MKDTTVKTKQLLKLALWTLAGLLPAVGCMSGRSSTTLRTAVEQALLSQSAEASLEKMQFNSFAGKTGLIRKDYFCAVDCEYVMGALQRKLLTAGMALADNDKSSATADLIIYPSVAHASIDDSGILIGFPEIPLTIPGMGSMVIPETAFFKYGSQKGLNRMVVYAKDAKTKKMAFTTDIVSSQKYYDRWVLLFIFSFRKTDLLPPH